MSKRIDFGPVLPIHRGDWQAGVTYERLNTVRYKSASWVCKALSTTAEPTTSSTDWFLQAEDSVSVASVNGQTGVVNITNTLSTPAIDDNSTLIANTAWVTDKIEQTVSDIDTSILAQASANTSTAIANAVNQMTTANDKKFATKLDLDVVRANVVDVVNDQAIAGVKTFSEPVYGPTATAGTNTTQLATTAFVNIAVSGKASDDEVVKLSDNQTINGIKTFSSPISGSITGNAATATKATQDGNGDVITATYLSKTDASNNYLGKNAKAVSATVADSATKASQDASGNTITTTYATKSDLASVSNVANAALPASKITYGTATLEAGVSALADGVIYFVYE